MLEEALAVARVRTSQGIGMFTRVENAEGKRARGGRGGRGEEGEEEKKGEEEEARPRCPVTADLGYQGWVWPAPRPAVQGLSPESADSRYPVTADFGYQGWVWARPAPRGSRICRF